MPESVILTFRKIHATPLRDLLRGRTSQRLDWKTRLAAAGLPAAAAELIRRVVKRTRLYRLEKAAVADELIAHFLDGLAHGNGADELIGTFGDERAAARLIGRAKRRGRAWPWRACGVLVRAIAVVAGIYAILFIRFCLGHPNPSIDYVARLNEPIAQTAQSDRAWPLWRQAILACSNGTKNGSLTFPDEFSPRDTKPPWPQTADWLDHHAAAIEIARQAGQKPALGFILGPGGSADDPAMFPSHQEQMRGEPLITVLLPHLTYLYSMSRVLSLDAKLAAERGEGARVDRDLAAMIGLGRQLRTSGGFLICQLVGLGVNNQAVSRLRFILFKFPNLLSDGQLIDLAHALSGPRVAADLLSLTDSRYAFADVVQRLYTDNGDGDGRMTLSGLRSFEHFTTTVHGSDSTSWDLFAATSAIPYGSASRAELMNEYERRMAEMEANLRRPIREVDIRHIDAELTALRELSIGRLRYVILAELTPRLTSTQASCERSLGERDGAAVGIALELFRRQRGRFPSTLTELTPQFLPEVPADRITGDPVRYRLVNGKPVVYSVGVDRVDDGGKMPDADRTQSASPNFLAASWDRDPRKPAPHGDWLLFGPALVEDDGE